jgi:hypothetical protein
MLSNAHPRPTARWSNLRIWASGQKTSYQPPWQQAVADQLQTAAAHNDYRTYARMGVDNQLKSIAVDKETGHEYDWEALFRGLLLVDHQTLIVLATEMLYRLSGNTP